MVEVVVVGASVVVGATVFVVVGAAVVVVVVVVDVDVEDVEVAGTVVSELSSDDPHAAATRATDAHTSRYLFMFAP